jgi:hypothetical protein
MLSKTKRDDSAGEMNQIDKLNAQRSDRKLSTKYCATMYRASGSPYLSYPRGAPNEMLRRSTALGYLQVPNPLEQPQMALLRTDLPLLAMIAAKDWVQPKIHPSHYYSSSSARIFSQLREDTVLGIGTKTSEDGYPGILWSGGCTAMHHSDYPAARFGKVAGMIRLTVTTCFRSFQCHDLSTRVLGQKYNHQVYRALNLSSTSKSQSCCEPSDSLSQPAQN